MKLSDMGVSGLVDYAFRASNEGGRRGAMKQTAAANVVRRRYGAEGVRRFKRAVTAAYWLSLRISKQAAAQETP